jgi:hypothetical protein
MEAQHELSAAQLDQLYRLAWLVLGDERRAAGKMQNAKRNMQHAETFALLLATLAPQRTLGYALRVPAAANERSGLTPGEFAALARLLRAATPQARLELGAPHLLDAQGQGDKGASGSGTDDGRRTTDDADAEHAAGVGGRSSVVVDRPWPRRATNGVELLLLLARAWGDLPAETPYMVALEHARALVGGAADAEVQVLRAVLLLDGPAGAQSRAVRAGLRRADERLEAALPALFAGEAPAELHALYGRAADGGAARPAGNRARRLQFGLAAAVLALVIAVIAMPGPSADPPQTAAERTGLLAAEAALSPDALVLAALDRFERAERGPGALYERYRMTVDGETRTLERWYDPGEPERVRIELRDSGDQLLYGLATDGTGRLQTRWMPPGETAPIFGVDYRLDAAQIAQMMPTLRRQPDGLHFFASIPVVNPEHFYLSQAYAAEVRDLGSTTIGERPARLIGFASRQPLPYDNDFAFDRPAAPPQQEQADQVILAIDPSTFALLEARVLPQGEAAGAVVTPWRAEAIALRSGLTAADFQLAEVEFQRRDGANRFISPRIGWVPDDALTDLNRVVAASALPLAFPPPDQPSYGYALQAGSEAILVRESEHEIFMVAVFPVEAAPQPSGRQEDRQAGDLRYRMIYPNEPPGGRAASLAALPLENGAELQMYYQHAYATLGEREARIAELLTALEPLTRESVDVLAADFVR